MKKISTILLIAIAVMMTSCNNDTTNTATKESKDATVAVADTHAEAITGEDGSYVVINKESVLGWEAKGVGHGHNGTVNIIAGKYDIQEGKIIRGKLEIDLTSMTSLDLKDAEKNKDLLDHLKNEDFFNVVKFPTASINITDGSDMENVKADVTIKGVTKEVVFPASLKDGNIKAMIVIDRTDFGITYNSKNFFKNLGDYMVEDEINFTVNLVGKLR